jgi:hypothetical protein
VLVVGISVPWWGGLKGGVLRGRFRVPTPLNEAEKENAMNFKEETALRMLEIAATLASACANSGVKYKTKSYKGNTLPKIEEAFADCLDEVRVHFEDLSAGNQG